MATFAAGHASQAGWGGGVVAIPDIKEKLSALGSAYHVRGVWGGARCAPGGDSGAAAGESLRCLYGASAAEYRRASEPREGLERPARPFRVPGRPSLTRRLLSFPGRRPSF